MDSPAFDLLMSVRQATPFSIDVDLSCHGGELLALVGPSGSGKSTLLRMIAGLVKPSSGFIRSGEEVWFDHNSKRLLSPANRHVGYVPQSYGLFPHMSALNNVLSGLGHLAKESRTTQALNWLANVHLEGLGHRRPAELSGGQQQRVALARALAREPRILLLDEPFVSVDRFTREALYLELAELKRHLAIPVIMVTHDLEEALNLCDQMAILVNGRVLQSAPPREIMFRPDSAIVARQIGAANIIEGIVLRHDKERKRTHVQSGSAIVACPLAENKEVGQKIQWVAPNDSIRLPSLSAGTLPPSENHFRMTVLRLLPMGMDALIVVQPDGFDQPLKVKVGTALVESLSLASGQSVEFVLREDLLHILPNDGC